jgi:acetyl esterase/lipase
MIFVRAGGWVLGNLDSDNAFCSHVASGASCVSINVNYRHAPEDVFPAAVDDVFEALEWVAGPESSSFKIDRTRIIIGGTSA